MNTPQQESKKDSWETQEVLNWLLNDESSYDALLGKSADEIREFVVDDHSAPEGLYDSFAEPPVSSFDNVDWEEVAESLAE
jgi:hypothetical protein